MSIARYMMLCLSHPEHGYYTTGYPIGAKGDFVTAPEISQLFGEMIGIWLVNSWIELGGPPEFILAELGPGRGTLMADILRATANHSGFSKARRVYLVETSPSLRDQQATILEAHDVSFVDTVNDLPNAPIFMIANEFFDALPIQQYVKTDIGWQERCVDNNGSAFKITLTAPKQNSDLDKIFPNLPTGIIVERSTISENISESIGARIQKYGGVALFIDYGDWSGVGDTFQSVKGHSSSTTLENQGQSDLTAHVQFQRLAIASLCETQFTTQGMFLEQMGITERAQTLAKPLSNTKTDTLIASHRRLVHQQEMGELFKVLALRATKQPELIGFEK
ncbi:MAG: SAM-dependent methyltransferase [Rhodobacteraceae bacterium]|nr:SAM-dependent methyltransferase [Paracoccaceae bacterium]